MNENSLRKCRSCLKSNTKLFPLTKRPKGSKPRRNYGQLLKELVTPDCIAEYEHLMPQYLCTLCCRSLRNSHAFIKQAQYSNSKLIHDIFSKQLNYLQEKTMDLPEIANCVEKSLEIKMEENYVDCQKEQNIDADKHGFNDINLKLEVPIYKTLEHNDDSVKKEIINSNENDFPLEYSSTSEKKVDNLRISSKKCVKPEKDTVCPICEKDMNRLLNLIKHLRTEHGIEGINKLPKKQISESGEEVFACKLCSSKYNNKYMYLHHIKHKHSIDNTKEENQKKDTIIKCDSCEYTAGTYAALNYHNLSKHWTENDKFKCKFCTYTCFKKINLFTHVKNSHKEQIKTLRAETKSEGIWGQILNDATLATSKLPLKQDDIFTNANEDSSSDEDFIRSILNMRKRQTNSTTSLARRCDECGKVYKNYTALYTHKRRVHISEDKYCLCPHCGKKYKHKTELKIHIDKVHINKNATEMVKQPSKVREKRFMCTECSYVCATITTLNIHVNRHHTGVRPYKCDICSKTFIVAHDLKTHRYLHTGERPFKCPICSKGFRDSSHMLKHKRIHSSERPYKCKDCNKSFTLSYNLSVHTRTHLKEKKLYCTICGKVFVNMSLLNIHRISENHYDEIL